MEDIQVSIGADVSGLKEGLNEAENAIEKTGDTFFKLSTDISNNLKKINQIDLANLNAALKAGELSFIGFSNSSTKAGDDTMKSLNKLKADLNDFKAAADKATDIKVLNEYNKKIEETESLIKRLSNDGKTGFDKLGNSAIKTGNNVKVGTGEAAFALTNLGRVAQDAPFGFVGIQNNLNPLLESFQRLQAETGSTGSALKALVSSLMGPAGLGVALSLVSAGVLLYTQHQQHANKVVTDAKKSNDDYINSLDQVKQAQLKGAENAQKELTTLKLLHDTYADFTNPLNIRKDAYEQMQKEYPEYFKNISFEKSTIAQVDKAYAGLTEAILATARARAAEDLITKNSTRALENEQKIKDLQVEKLKKEKALREAKANDQYARATATQGVGSSAYGGIGNALTPTGIIKAEKELLAVKKQIANTQTDTNILTGRNLQLAKLANAEILKRAKLIGSPGEDDNNISDKEKKLKSVDDILKELNEKLAITDNLTTLAFGEDTKRDLKDINEAISELTKINTEKSRNEISKLQDEAVKLNSLIRNRELDKKAETTIVGIKKKVDDDDQKRSLENAKEQLENLKKVGAEIEDVYQGITRETNDGKITFFDTEYAADQFDRMMKLTSDFNKEFSGLVQDSIGGTLGNLGTAIGEEFASVGGVLSAVGQTLLQAFGQFLSEMGGLLIKYGTLAVIKGKLDVAIFAGGPLSIVAGIAAIGVGIALKAAGAAIGAAAKSGNTSQGGGGSTPQFYSTSSSPAATSKAGSSPANGGTSIIGHAQIKGEDLFLSLQRYEARTR